jgi:hypothetical protein
MVGYSSKRKAYKCFNLRLNRIVESINVMIDESNGRKIKERSKDLVERDQEEDVKEEEVDEESDEEEEQPEVEQEQRDLQGPPKTPSKRVQKNHPSDQIIGNTDAGVETRRRICSPKQ